MRFDWYMCANVNVSLRLSMSPPRYSMRGVTSTKSSSFAFTLARAAAKSSPSSAALASAASSPPSGMSAALGGEGRSVNCTGRDRTDTARHNAFRWGWMRVIPSAVAAAAAAAAAAAVAGSTAAADPAKRQ